MDVNTDPGESLKCPVCQDLFVDPVSLRCGHDFCLSCIQTVWDSDGSVDGPFFCPECQILLPSKPPLDINPILQARVSAAVPFSVPCDHCIAPAVAVAVLTCVTCDASLCQAHAQLHQQRPALRGHTVVEVTPDPLTLKCREHREELKVFCFQDRVPVCCLCVLVGVHQNHRAAQLHDACADFKNVLESTMKQLMKRRREAENALRDLEEQYSKTLKSAAECRERISDKYSRIHVVLDGDERLMMQIVDAEEATMVEWLEAQRGLVEAQIQEIDSLQASSKSLLQEANNLRFLQQITAQNLCDPLDLPPIQDVDRALCDPEKLRTLEQLVDDLSTALSQHFPRMWSYLSCPALDSRTAHPQLEISVDRRRVSWRRRPTSVSATGDGRPYDSQYSVLAEDGFTSGRRYWEVIVQEKPYWLIGITTGTTPGSDPGPGTAPGPGPDPGPEPDSTPRPGGGGTSWCIYHAEGRYVACRDAQEEQLSVGKRVRKLGVLADLHKGELSFYDADTMTLLHSFCVQCQEPLFPMFNPCINVNGLNQQPITVFWIKEPWDWDGNNNTKHTRNEQE